MKRSRSRHSTTRPAVRRPKTRARADRRRLAIAAFEQWQRSWRSFGTPGAES